MYFCIVLCIKIPLFVCFSFKIYFAIYFSHMMCMMCMMCIVKTFLFILLQLLSTGENQIFICDICEVFIYLCFLFNIKTNNNNK